MTDTYDRSLEKSYSQKKQTLTDLQSYKTEYDDLIHLLEHQFPSKVRHEIMVPFGPGAFFRGEIRHTNEVIMHLGDNWFAERTVKNCVKTLKERRKEVEESVQNQEGILKLIEDRRQMLKDNGVGGVVKGQVKEQYQSQKLQTRSESESSQKSIGKKTDTKSSSEVDPESQVRDLVEEEGDLEKWIESQKAKNLKELESMESTNNNMSNTNSPDSSIGSTSSSFIKVNLNDDDDIDDSENYSEIAALKRMEAMEERKFRRDDGNSSESEDSDSDSSEDSDAVSDVDKQHIESPKDQTKTNSTKRIIQESDVLPPRDRSTLEKPTYRIPDTMPNEVTKKVVVERNIGEKARTVPNSTVGNGLGNLGGILTSGLYSREFANAAANINALNVNDNPDKPTFELPSSKIGPNLIKQRKYDGKSLKVDINESTKRKPMLEVNEKRIHKGFLIESQDNESEENSTQNCESEKKEISDTKKSPIKSVSDSKLIEVIADHPSPQLSDSKENQTITESQPVSVEPKKKQSLFKARCAK